MKTAKYILIVTIVLTHLKAEDLMCKYVGIVDDSICVEVKNVTDKDIVIMSGRSEKLIKFGVAFFNALKYSIKVMTVGHDLAMFEKPEFILLPANDSRQFQCAIPKASRKSEVIQLVMELKYLPYDSFSVLMRQHPDGNFEWGTLMKSLVYNRERIKQLGASYSFDYSMGGSREAVPPLKDANSNSE